MVSSAVKEHELLYPSLGRTEFSDMFKKDGLDWFLLGLTLVCKTEIQTGCVYDHYIEKLFQNFT
jgi:hypothetical protein